MRWGRVRRRSTAFFLDAIAWFDEVKHGDPAFMAVAFMKTQKVDRVAAELLLRLWELTGEERYRRAGEAVIYAFLSDRTFHLVSSRADGTGVQLSSSDAAALAAANKRISNILRQAQQKGEPYERAMVYYYRGLIFLRNGDYENARAEDERAAVEGHVPAPPGQHGERSREHRMHERLGGERLLQAGGEQLRARIAGWPDLKLVGA